MIKSASGHDESRRRIAAMTASCERNGMLLSKINVFRYSNMSAGAFQHRHSLENTVIVGVGLLPDINGSIVIW